MSELWSRRFTREGAVRAVIVEERAVLLDGERIETPGAGWSFVRGAQAIVASLREGWAASDAPAVHRFHPALELTWDPAAVSHPAVEVTIGEALLGLDPRSPAGIALLELAAPLVLLEWPVGFRFGEVFETHAGPAVDRALAAVATELASQKTAKLPVELARLAALMKNRAALAPLLTLVERGAPFDGWMDVVDLAAEVGRKDDAVTLKRLAKGRIAGDVREALLAVAHGLARG